MKSVRAQVAGLLGASAILAGCAGTPAYGPRYADTAYVAPPPPYVEYVGPPPAAGHVWISGYWNWGGHRHVWVPGHWEAPRHGHHWVPHRWEREGDRWRPQGGYWERERHERPRPQVYDSPRPPPPPRPSPPPSVVRPVEPVPPPGHIAPPDRDGRHRLQREVLPPHPLPQVQRAPDSPGTAGAGRGDVRYNGAPAMSVQSQPRERRREEQGNLQRMHPAGNEDRVLLRN